jgi:hypothetical protein
MSRNEKLYFRNEGNESRNGKSSLYMKLFDCISKQKTYDEQAILKQLSPAISKKNIAYQKHYLYNLLNDSLVRYDNRNNPEQLIYKNIQLIRVKRKKGLLDEALLLWRKTMQQARQVELFSMSQLLKKEFEKMIMFSSVQIRYDELHDVFRSNTLTYDYYAEMITLRDIYAEIVMLRRKAHFDFDEKVKKHLLELKKQVIAKKHGLESPSFWHRHYTGMCLATLHFLFNELDPCLDLIKKGIDDWWKNHHFIEPESEHYLELLYLVNYAGIKHGAYHYVESVFNHQANLLIKEDRVKAGFEVLKYLALNKIYNKTARYQDVKKLVDQMKEAYTGWEPLLSAELNRTVCFSMGIASFVLDNYAESLQFIRRGVTYFKDGTREEQLVFAHLFLLLIQYMMGNPKLFEAQYKSTYGYLYKKKKLDQFEKILIHCFYDSFYLQSQKEKTGVFKNAVAELEINSGSEMQASILNIFNFKGWLESQVQRITYKEFVKRRYQEETEKIRKQSPVTA